eukprot:5727882-Prymnesium_polylepis.2
MWWADASTLALVAEQPNAHSDYVYSVGFSPDGTRIWRWGAVGSGRRCGRVLDAVHRFVDTGATGGAHNGESPRRRRVFCGLLAGRHEDRVVLSGQTRKDFGWASLAHAVLLCACCGCGSTVGSV